MPTIKDVAKRAGVSHGTVSNVLKGVNTVSIENIKKVEKAIAELGYKPNTSAQQLKASTSNSIYFILPSITGSLYPQLFTQASKDLELQGFDVSLYITYENASTEQRILNFVSGMKPSCIVIATCQPQNTAQFNSILSGGTPIVFIEREPEGLDCNFVGFDNEQTLYDLTKELIKKDLSPIALLVYSEQYSSETLCVEGYRRAYEKYGGGFDPKYIRYLDNHEQHAFNAVSQLFALNEPPKAIICSGTTLARSASKAAYYMSYEPFENIYALSEDNWTGVRSKAMHTVPRSASSMCSEVVNIISENVKNPAFFEKKKIYVQTIPDDYLFNAPPAVKKKTSKHIKAAMIEGEMSESIRSLLPAFTRETGIDVEIRAYPHESLYKTLSSESSLSESDVLMVDVLWLKEMARKGFLADLTSYITKEDLNEIDVDPMFFKAFARYGDGIFAIPYQYCCQLLFYRKDLFGDYLNRRMFSEQYKTELKPPETWAEFNAVAKFFTKQFNPESPVEYGTTLGGRFSSAAAVEFLDRLWAYGGDVFDRSGKVCLNNLNAVKALTNYVESYQYASPDSSENWWYEQVREFASGDAAMMIMFASYATSLFDRNLSKITENIGYAQVPGGPSVLGGWSLGISRKSRKIEPALEFIKWCCRKDHSDLLMLLGSQTLCSSLYKNRQILDIYPWLKETYDLFPTCRERIVPEECSGVTILDYESILAEHVRSCILGNASPEEALKNASDALSALLSS